MRRAGARCARIAAAVGLAGIGLGWLAACASLPEPVVAPPAEVVAPVAFATARGPLPPRQNNAVLQQLQAQAGSGDILEKHLVLEQSINPDNPLILGNHLILLEDGPATYRAMFAALRGARDHINLETYIFEDGDIGREFADLLIRKQAEGVQVNVIYDSVGSIATPRAFFDRMRDAGIRVLEYNPVNPVSVKRQWRLNNRDHRKLLVVDGRIAFLGGINISETYSSGSFSRPGRKKNAQLGWRDTHLQIEGPAVATLQKFFFDTWTRQKGEPVPARNYFPRQDRRGDEIVRVIASTSESDDSPIYLTLLSAVSHAERSIHLTMAYFVPDPQLRDALGAAARRGVDVQIVLPGKTDSWIVFHAGRSHYDELLDAGVRLYERPDTVLHSKTLVIDGVWATIGSTNLDWRSFLHNDELNAVVLGTDFARQMEAMFARDRAASVAVEPDRWRARSLWLRAQEWVARRFEYWL